MEGRVRATVSEFEQSLATPRQVHLLLRANRILFRLSKAVAGKHIGEAVAADWNDGHGLSRDLCHRDQQKRATTLQNDRRGADGRENGIASAKASRATYSSPGRAATMSGQLLEGALRRNTGLKWRWHSNLPSSAQASADSAMADAPGARRKRLFFLGPLQQEGKSLNSCGNFLMCQRSFADDVDGAGYLLKLDTFKPWCAIAGPRRTLIYPSLSVLRHCRGLWPARRQVRLRYAGFAQRSRHQILDEWHVRWFGRPLVPSLLRQSDELSKHLRDDLFASVAVVYSKAGRWFPGKVWDDAHYDFLVNSTMTLCPDGVEN